ncbi:hypothetical protein CIPAW_02G032800 [Carya illinoinensis]|uniref:RING-type E3 ubiquitin transferase n=1 Tax=Carya illinoinensis TaxID=32201 RepID=A0A8T1RBT5_CARIL|nr:hypothetical protein CIPAW_02G032800 [Carya illinoinensis]KAG6663552.1 hypothetical protein CIPAW_02G032800 [Carya illinoinensis]
MGGCCCSSRKAHLHGTPVYYYCPRGLEEHESLTSHDGIASALTAGFLVDLDSLSAGGMIIGSSFGTLTSCQDLEESDCKAQANSLCVSPRKLEGPNLNEPNVSSADEEDVCPICLEEYDSENPNIVTRCEHHFHLSCILEWRERSNACPICDQEMALDNTST